MDQARHRHVRIFTARVRHVVRRGPGFLDARNDLPPNRAIGIIALDQVEKMRRDGERELVAGKQHSGALFIGENEMLLELRQRRDAVLELPFPIVPEFRRDTVREISGRMRNELFSVFFAVGKSNHFDWRKKLRALNIVSMQAPSGAPRSPAFVLSRLLLVLVSDCRSEHEHERRAYGQSGRAFARFVLSATI